MKLEIVELLFNYSIKIKIVLNFYFSLRKNLCNYNGDL